MLDSSNTGNSINNSNKALNVGKTSKKSDKTCFYCDKPGHIKKNCFKFKKDKQLKSQTEVNNVAKDQSNDNILMYASALSSS